MPFAEAWNVRFAAVAGVLSVSPGRRIAVPRDCNHAWWAFGVSGAPQRAAAPIQSPVRDRMTRIPLDRSGEFAGAGAAGATQPIAPDRTGASAGELVLDGARFGRLICDRLARHIDHPRSGLTGADPRLTPTWPGAAWG